MSNTRYTAEFKAEAIKQITERGHGALEVSKRLGVSYKILYLWFKQAREYTSPNSQDVAALQKEISRMKTELKRTTEARDIPKKAAAYFAKQSD